MLAEEIYTQEVDINHRKKFAQFFTPLLIAEFMVNWVFENSNIKTLLEPAFGLGVFSRLALQKNKNIKIKGFDVDEIIFNQANKNFQNSNVNLYLEDYHGNGLKKFEPNDLNNAKILNIFDLDISIKKEILNLYNQYRDEIITNKIENLELLNMIDTILKNEFKAEVY